MANFFETRLFPPEELRTLGAADPQAAYAGLAGRCPVHQGPDGSLMLMRKSEIVEVNRRGDVLGPGAQGPSMGGQRRLVPLDLDGEEHLKFRRILDPLFSAKKMAALEPGVRRLADELIDGFIERGSADLQTAYCQPLPSIFFLRLMGLPSEDREQFLAVTDVLLGRLPPTMTMEERRAAFKTASERGYAYLAEHIDRRIANPADDLTSWLLAAEVDGHRLTRDNVLDISYLFIIAGLDTVTSSLACAIARLAREPQVRRRLVAQPELWGSAVEELLRYESPVATGYRTATTDLEVGGKLIKAGTTFYLSWSAANLDPAAFVDPLTLDIERHPNSHLAFGTGFHRCLGAHLARMELRIALEQLHRRIPEYSFKSDHELSISGMPRRVNALPLVW